MSIHKKNDSVKNKGYGTAAEIQVMECSFHEFGMETVYADAIMKNTRSQHALKKSGFIETDYNDNCHLNR